MANGDAHGQANVNMRGSQKRRQAAQAMEHGASARHIARNATAVRVGVRVCGTCKGSASSAQGRVSGVGSTHHLEVVRVLLDGLLQTHNGLAILIVFSVALSLRVHVCVRMYQGQQQM